MLSLCVVCFLVSVDNEDREVMAQVPSVLINEVCADNFSTAPLDGWEDTDWIELYNPTDETVDLSGFHITDNERKWYKCELPEYSLMPGEYLLLYASGKEFVGEDGVAANDEMAEYNGLFLDFRLKDEETIFLYNADGVLLDSVAVTPVRQNTSMARRIDGVSDWVNMEPTPGSTNNDAKTIQTVSVDKPVFSMDGGFYEDVVTVELSAADDADIYYTLDGSEPTKESLYYMDPIIVADRSEEPNDLSSHSEISTEYCYRYAPEQLMDKITVIRAVAVDRDGNRSEIATNSYIVDIYEKDTYQDLYMVSLSTDSNRLFDLETGLYVLGLDYIVYAEENGYEIEEGGPRPNYLSRGKMTEIPAHIEVFDATGVKQLDQEIGLRVRGATTRFLSQKSFSLFAREMYSGTNTFHTDIYNNGYQYDRLTLLSDRDIPKIRHELHAKLLEERAVTSQDFIRCNVFLDGEYWGLYSIAEVYTEEFIENHYGISKEDVIIYEGLNCEELEAICNNELLSDKEKYILLNKKIDMDSLMDYYASMIYIDHYDWLAYNGYMWKSSTITDKPYQDGKWRWMLYDTELCEGDPTRNTFKEGNVSNWERDVLIQTLMKSEEFRSRFVTVFMDLADTVFEKEHVIETIDALFGEYSQAVEAQGIRWGDDWADEVYQDLDAIKDFYRCRREYIVGYLEEEFGLEKGSLLGSVEE